MSLIAPSRESWTRGKKVGKADIRYFGDALCEITTCL